MIPASLVVVLTITFAVSTKRMAARHVIVRKLDSIEALGAVSDVCSDKTGDSNFLSASIMVTDSSASGTLTQGRMVARIMWLPFTGTWILESSGDPFNPHDGRMTFQKNIASSTGPSQPVGL